MTIQRTVVEQDFSVVLFVFQFYPVFNFGQFINFGLGSVASERVKPLDYELETEISSSSFSHPD